mmetsp:Transcript_17420/g.33070  ORF Transcript_17420/g.33070 Transcript_17420/m.33070 type:complete len:180 (+) Transcript_17420:116-655(+)|eukprot:scaffold14782_cov174-Amphora_coffeaeformis.AAC.2
MKSFFPLSLLLATSASSHMMMGDGEHHSMMGNGEHHMMGNGKGGMGHCPFRVQIDGNDVQDGTCFESPSDGILATVIPGSEREKPSTEIVIWDTDTPCDNKEELYIHFAGEPDGVMRLAMAADVGESVVHTYKAALFDSLPVPEGTTGCFRLKMGCKMMGRTMEWKVARHDVSCDEDLS